ncbi:type II toxin-antitoxin system RelE/ParE family toxin [Desulfoplanes sp.]
MKATKVRWTHNALRDLEKIRLYLEENADAKAMLSGAQRIWDSCQRLRHSPESGRPGRVPMTRELIAPPYSIPYRVKDGAVEILNVFHAAQKR